MAARPPRREALATPGRTLPDFGGADDLRQTDIVPTPLRLLEDSAQATNHEPRYIIRGEFEYGGLPNVHLGFLEGAGGFRRAAVVQRLGRVRADRATAPSLSPDALLGCHTRHPNVIPVLDLIESYGEQLLVLEYVISTTLARLLWHGNRMPLPVTSSIVSGVLHALHAAHTAIDGLDEPLEIVHGSVAPENVLVGVDGTARLIHFGQAKGIVKSMPAGRNKGGYVSPEQVFDRRADARSDVFSAGALLWECLSGRPLLEGGSAVDSMLRFISRPVTPPSAFNPHVPAALDTVLARALEPTPERRFQTAQAFADELEALVEPASREELARYVEGVAWSSIHEQRLLLRGPEDEEPTNIPISQLWDRSEPRAASGPRASVGPDDPTLSRGYFVNPNLVDLKSDWKTREPEEPTKVDGVRPPTPPPLPDPEPLEEAISESEPPLNLSPPPVARFETPRSFLRDDEIPEFREHSWAARVLPWVALVVALGFLCLAVSRTRYGRELGRELRELVSRTQTAPTSAPRPVATVLTPRAPLSVDQIAKAASSAVATPPTPTPAAAPTPSLRVLTLDELPLSQAAAEEKEPTTKRGKNKRSRKGR